MQYIYFKRRDSLNGEETVSSGIKKITRFND